MKVNCRSRKLHDFGTDKLSAWAKKNKLTFNKNKPKVMFMSRWKIKELRKWKYT